MNESPKNRRLQIMPEVLPAPTRAPSTSNVRGRTVAHMQRLLATAAAAIPLADCTKADTQSTQTVTIPAASTSGSPSAQATIEGSLLPPPKVTATATATAPPDMGYAVVDPMPAPARCMGLSAASKSSASFKSAAGGVVLEIALTLPVGSAWAGSAFDTTNKPSPWSGTLVSSTITSHSATVHVKPSASVTQLGITFPISCNAGSGSISVTASFADPPTTSTKVALALHDY
jgi:hypothetical protein